MPSAKLYYCLLVLALVQCCYGSIEKDPVKVTHKNSGPSYDISEDVEKVKVPSSDEGNFVLSPPARPMQPSGGSQDENQDDPIGHITIRRIFLVPMIPPQSSDSSPASVWSRNPFMRRPMDDDSDASNSVPRNPLWSLFGPMRHQSSHVFGSDQASRPPLVWSSANSGVEKESSSDDSEREESSTNSERQSSPNPDPIQMLLNIMLNSLNSANLGPQLPGEGQNIFTDLNKESSSKPNDTTDIKPTMAQDNSVEKRIKPTSTNETHEDVVEIEGKKFLRKVVMNRHVGDNMVFITRRLIFVPLNETDSTNNLNSTSTSTSTTTLAPMNPKDSAEPKSTMVPDASNQTNKPTERVRPSTEEATTTTTTTTTTIPNDNQVEKEKRDNTSVKPDDSSARL